MTSQHAHTNTQIHDKAEHLHLEFSRSVFLPVFLTTEWSKYGVCYCVSMRGWPVEHSVQTSASPAVNSLHCYHGRSQCRNINEWQKEERGGARESDRQRGRWGGDQREPLHEYQGIPYSPFARYVICLHWLMKTYGSECRCGSRGRA